MAVDESPRPKPRARRSRRKKTLTDAQRARLLERETEACGPHQLIMRHAAVNQAMKAGDARMLMGALDDLAACAVVYRDRVEQDMKRTVW